MNRHVKAPRPHPARSDRAKPKLTVQFEPFQNIVREFPPLFEKQWRELEEDQDTIPLSVNWDILFNYANFNILRVHTVRDEGRLVGFIFNLLMPPINHKGTPFCFIERFWLDKTYRSGCFAYNWFKQNDAAMAEVGARKIVVGENVHFMGGRVGLIFKRLGYKPWQQSWSKLLEPHHAVRDQ